VAADLTGYTVGITADRRGEDQAVMFRRMGATVVHGPTIHTVETSDLADLRKRTEELIAEPADYLIANTGLGIRTWMAHATTWGLDESLRRSLASTRIAARGPKAAGALSIAGLTTWWRSASEQLSDVTQHLASTGVAGKTVAFQLHGADSHGVVERLDAAGATVIPLPVYRWTAPPDSEAAHRLIALCCEGSIHAVTFTAGPQVSNMLDLADAIGRANELIDALNGQTVVGCIGPVCAAVAEEEGLKDPVVPANWRLGSLVKAVGEALTARDR
jgi:uroporphyrinogen-III synthase